MSIIRRFGKRRITIVDVNAPKTRARLKGGSAASARSGIWMDSVAGREPHSDGIGSILKKEIIVCAMMNANVLPRSSFIFLT